ncbi:MAG: chorismate-binding protein [Planctomycetes bacterium]|nr:chorismate-binding protein [Planctomycetota bacterium]
MRCLQINGDQLRFDAGGGIVIDSQAPSEWQELHDKASAMRASIQPV